RRCFLVLVLIGDPGDRAAYGVPGIRDGQSGVVSGQKGSVVVVSQSFCQAQPLPRLVEPQGRRALLLGCEPELMRPSKRPGAVFAGAPIPCACGSGPPSLLRPSSA